MHARLIISVAILATMAIYWTGLYGPFILDDAYNLEPLKLWLTGQPSALEVIFGNNSGLLGRPISMASFLLSAATGGLSPFSFKLGNLLIHIACGLIGWQFLRLVLGNEPRFSRHAGTAAAAAAALWLLHPINVSTVLYAVQRMAQLSALFVLATVLVYVLGRKQLAAGQCRSAIVKLFVLFPLFWMAGLFSKENAAVAPALCLVLELAYFRTAPRPRRILPIFFGLFLLIPATSGGIAILATPEDLFGLYTTRDFTLVERLLSQPRALMEYIGLLIWPRGSLMGVYVDDFATSTSLWSPPSTLPSILALFVISGMTIAIRKKAPGVFAGWFFFLTAHLVESSALPLELYFEHRNYLPAFGLLLSLASFLAWSLSILNRVPQGAMHKASYLTVALITVIFGWITRQQVVVWQSLESIISHAIENRPESLRATLESATLAIRAGRFDEARARVLPLTRSGLPRSRLIGQLKLFTIDCHGDSGGAQDSLSRVESLAMPSISLTEALIFRQLIQAVVERRCGPKITETNLADSISRIVDSAITQPDTSKPKWLMRFAAATLYVRTSSWDRAEAEAKLAWQPNADPAAGGLLIHIYIQRKKKRDAIRTLMEVEARVKPYEKIATQQLDSLKSQINAMPD